MGKWIFIAYILILSFVISFIYRYLNPEWIYYSKAESFYKKKKYDLAIDYYFKAIENGVSSYFIGDHFVNSLKRTKDYKSAHEFLDQLMKDTVLDLKQLNNLADFFWDIEKYRDCELIYSHILKKYPEDIITRYEFALVLSREEKYDEAIDQYKIILSEL